MSPTLWQRKFSIIWPCILTFFVFISLLHLVRSIRNGRAYTTLLGVSEDLRAGVRHRVSYGGTVENWIAVAGAVFWWMLPGLERRPKYVYYLSLVGFYSPMYWASSSRFYRMYCWRCAARQQLKPRRYPQTTQVPYTSACMSSSQGGSSNRTRSPSTRRPPKSHASRPLRAGDLSRCLRCR